MTQIAFGVLTWARQLFCEIRLAGRLSLLAAVEGWIGGNVLDVDAVRAAGASLEETTSESRGLWEMFRYVAQTSAVCVNVTVFCHGEGGVSDANCWGTQQQYTVATCRVHTGLCRSKSLNQDTGRVCVTQENHERVTKEYPVKVT